MAIDLRFWHKCMISGCSLVLFVGLLEVSLRLLRVNVEITPIQVVPLEHDVFREDWGDAWHESLKFNQDARLSWRPAPNKFSVNSLGFRGREITRQKPKQVTRIVCLGDSCTFSGPDTYPELLEQALNWQAETVAYEVINAGVTGYSSYQGLLCLQEHGVPLTPDVITVYFGWNDHWLTKSMPDNYRETVNSFSYGIRSLLHRTRFYPWTIRLYSSFVSNGHNQPTMKHFRVPLESYRQNLQEIVVAAKAHNVKQVIFITAPPGYHPEVYSSVHDMSYNVELGKVESVEQLVALHRDYNQVVREVAAATSCSLVDLEAKVLTEYPTNYFKPDLIHLELPGRFMACQEIANKLQQLRVIRGSDLNRVENFYQVNLPFPRTLTEQVQYLERKIQFGLASNEIHYWLAMIYRDLKDFASARKSFERVVDQGILFPYYYTHFADVCSVLGDSTMALNLYRKAQSVDPGTCGHWINRGLILYQLQHFEEAEREFLQARALCPENKIVYWNLGYTYKSMGKIKPAIANFRRWYAMDQHNVEPLGNLIELYLHSGNYAKAAETLDLAQKLSPDNEWIVDLRKQYHDVSHSSR